MSEAIKMKHVSTEVYKVDMHETIPNLSVSRTLSPDTLPQGRISYSEGSPILKVETKSKIVYIPITNVKAIWMK